MMQADAARKRIYMRLHNRDKEKTHILHLILMPKVQKDQCKYVSFYLHYSRHLFIWWYTIFLTRFFYVR